MSTTLGFRLGRLGRLARKELTEILRDRRTLVTLVVMPLLLYPLLAVSFRVFLRSKEIEEKGLWVRFGFRDEPEAGQFLEWYNRAKQDLFRLAEQADADEGDAPHVAAEVVPDLDEAVRIGMVDIAFQPRAVDNPHARPGKVVVDLEMVYRPDNDYARQGVAFLRRAFAAHNQVILSNKLINGGLPQRPDAYRLLERRLPAEERPAFSLAVFVPLVLILMTITGAVYPAIDLTAGERERGTLEVLIAAPIPRMSVLFGKYVAVLSVAVLTALINLLSMGISLALSGQATRILGPAGMSPLVLVELFGLVLLFAVFFSAVLLVVTSFARSFKEAQAALVPLMLLSLAPGVVGLIPGLPLAGPLAMVPLLNIVLLSRDLLEGRASLPWATAVVGSTLLYAALALLLAARLFGTEAVLYAEAGRWRRLFRS